MTKLIKGCCAKRLHVICDIFETAMASESYVRIDTNVITQSIVSAPYMFICFLAFTLLFVRALMCVKTLLCCIG